jgi:hypothetical protein
VLPQAAGAVAAFQLASFASMAIRHGRFAAMPGRRASRAAERPSGRAALR